METTQCKKCGKEILANKKKCEYCKKSTNETWKKVGEYCKWIEPPVRRNEPLNARNRAGYCERESHPTIFIYRINLLYNEVACLRA